MPTRPARLRRSLAPVTYCGGPGRERAAAPVAVRSRPSPAGAPRPVDLAAAPDRVPVHLRQDVDHREVQLGTQTPDGAVALSARRARRTVDRGSDGGGELGERCGEAQGRQGVESDVVVAGSTPAHQDEAMVVRTLSFMVVRQVLAMVRSGPVARHPRRGDRRSPPPTHSAWTGQERHAMRSWRAERGQRAAGMSTRPPGRCRPPRARTCVHRGLRPNRSWPCAPEQCAVSVLALAPAECKPHASDVQVHRRVDESRLKFYDWEVTANGAGVPV
jgi:hypothetical protein